MDRCFLRRAARSGLPRGVDPRSSGSPASGRRKGKYPGPRLRSSCSTPDGEMIPRSSVAKNLTAPGFERDPRRAFAMVDFPEPEPPTSATRVPGFKVKLKSSMRGGSELAVPEGRVHEIEATGKLGRTVRSAGDSSWAASDCFGKGSILWIMEHVIEAPHIAMRFLEFAPRLTIDIYRLEKTHHQTLICHRAFRCSNGHPSPVTLPRARIATLLTVISRRGTAERNCVDIPIFC